MELLIFQLAVVEDYLNNRSNVTEDVDYEVIKPLLIDAEKVQECDATMPNQGTKS